MKKILSLTLVFMMALSLVAIPEAFAAYRGNTLIVTAYSTAPSAETKVEITGAGTKLTNNEFCSTSEVARFSETGKTAFANGDFTVSVPNGGYINFGFNGNSQNQAPYFITGLGLWVNAQSHFKFIVQSDYWTKENGFNNWKTVYEGETKLLSSNLVDNGSSVSYYYPIVFDSPLESLNNVRVIVTEIYDDSLTETADFTEVQIYNQDTVSKNNGAGTGLPNLFTKSILRDKLLVGTTDTNYRANSTGKATSVTHKFSNEMRTWSPYAAGFAVSAVAVEEGKSVLFNIKTPYFYDGNSFPDRGGKATGIWPAYESSWNSRNTSYNDVAIVPDTTYDTDCWWMVDMLDVKQAINHIKLNAKSGVAKKVEVYKTDVRGVEFGSGSTTNYAGKSKACEYKYDPSNLVLKNGGFGNPEYTGWELVATAECETGVEEVYIHDAEPATLWMVKVTEYTDDLQLLPFDVYLKGETSLPVVIENANVEGELTPGATLTYSVDVENQNGAAKVFFALYENEKLASVTLADINLKANDEAGKYDTATATYTIPVTATGQLSVKAFLLDSLAKLIPLTLPAELPISE